MDLLDLYKVTNDDSASFLRLCCKITNIPYNFNQDDIKNLYIDLTIFIENYIKTSRIYHTLLVCEPLFIAKLYELLMITWDGDSVLGEGYDNYSGLYYMYDAAPNNYPTLEMLESKFNTIACMLLDILTTPINALLNN